MKQKMHVHVQKMHSKEFKSTDNNDNNGDVNKGIYLKNKNNYNSHHTIILLQKLQVLEHEQKR